MRLPSGVDLRVLFPELSSFNQQLLFKVADSRDEVEQSFAILHDGYVKRGVMAPQTHGLRVTKYHFLPTTHILVMKHGDEVIATLSLIRDNPFGFPMSQAWDISPLRKQGLSIAEISALTVKEGYKGRGLLLPIFKYLTHFVCRHLNLDAVIMSTEARSAMYYQRLLNFQPLEADPKSYGAVRGELSVGQFALVNPFLAHHKNRLRSRSPFKFFDSRYMLSRFLLNQSYQRGFQFPDQIFKGTSRPSLSRQMIRYFAFDRTDFYRDLQDNDIARINTSLYEEVFPLRLSSSIRYHLRHSPRYYVNLDAYLAGPIAQKGSLQSIRKLRLWNLGERGFSILTSLQLELGSTVQVRVDLPTAMSVYVKAQVVGTDENGAFGLEILGDPPQEWQDYIAALSLYYSHYILNPKQPQQREEIS